MGWPTHIWSQLKSISADDLIAALERDDWSCDMDGGAMRIYLKDRRRVSVHYHPRKTFGPKLLQSLLNDIGWSEADMKRLKLVK